jgi:hypothetical protein
MIKKCSNIAGDFDNHATSAIRSKSHHLMGCIHGFMQSYYVPPLGECLCCIAPAAAMVIVVGLR